MANTAQSLVAKLEDPDVAGLVNELQLAYRYHHALSEIGTEILTRAVDSETAKTRGAYDLMNHSVVRDAVRRSKLYGLARQEINKRSDTHVAPDWVGWVRGSPEEFVRSIRKLAEAEVYKGKADMYCPSEEEVRSAKEILESAGLTGIFIDPEDLEATFLKDYVARSRKPNYWDKISGIPSEAKVEIEHALEVLRPLTRASREHL